MSLEEREYEKLYAAQNPEYREARVTELLEKYEAECAEARETYAEVRESAVRRAMMELELLGVDLTSMVRTHLAALCRIPSAGEPLRRSKVTFADREIQLEIYA